MNWRCHAAAIGVITCLLLGGMPLSAQEFLGSQACGSCHQEAYAAWLRSDHRQALQPVNENTVLGDFNDVRFEHFGTITRFFRREGGWFVATANAQGQPQEFRIAWTIGVQPLQQYVVEFPDGRLQALSVSWDSRPRSAGGQRWFHLYPDQPMQPQDALHWTGAFQNANARCAFCHTTNFAKNYSRDTDRYTTQWSEAGVGCEACHGPGSRHVTWAFGNRGTGDNGLTGDLRRAWDASLARPVPHGAATQGMSRQLQVCAACHSRRSELQAFDASGAFFDNFQLMPLAEGLYHADGQIQDEVYEIGSFLQSRMHADGVSCSNCHDPHSNALRVTGNGLCLQCHEPAKFQRTEHHLHQPESTGARCVACHMPAKTYMGVDVRRDHSFRVPDPVASESLGMPNACGQCHTDRDARWAMEQLAPRHAARASARPGHAAAFATARSSDAGGAPQLLSLVGDPGASVIVRATALLESARFPSPAQRNSARSALESPDPLLRANAAAALQTAEPAQRWAMLMPLLDDPVKAVRMSVARQLAELPAGVVASDQRGAWQRLLAEYESSLIFTADLPESLVELARLHRARGRVADAEAALLQARKLAPRYLPAMLNLADLHRVRGRDDRAQALLEQAMALYPDAGDVHYALGLLYVRMQRRDRALTSLRQAAALSPANVLYLHTYALALADAGNTAAALRVLDLALQRFPGDALLLALRSRLSGN